MDNSQLPEFPEFTSLEAHHQATINQSVSSHPPYSDYNFISLWSYDHQRTYKLASLNGNLVIRFQDYTDMDDYFYSFLGTSKPDETAETLLQHSKKEGKDQLKLIPEKVIQSLKHRDRFIITEDQDNHDYIIATKNTTELYGSKSKKRDFNKFIRKYASELKVRELDIADSKTAEEIIDVFEEWRAGEGPEGNYNASEHAALKKLLREHPEINTEKLHIVGVYLGGKLSAFCIAEILEKGFAIGHYAKALKKHRLLGNALDVYTAKSLAEKGVTHFNYEQDMGIKGLRESKMSKQPVYFLKKYNISKY